jgi:drug/metabolite transporter (DMT)-like permease
MSERAIGVLLAVAAAVAFESSYVLLAAQSRQLETVVRPSLSFLRRLLMRPWWLVAMALNGVGFFLELAALTRVSLAVVQPLLALGLVALVIAAALILHEPVGPKQFAGAAMVAVGATLVILGAPRGTSNLPVDAWTVATITALGAILAFPNLARSGVAWALVATTAAGDTLVALATNSVAANWPHRVLAAIAGVAAVAVCGTMSVTSESAALQRLPASRVGPIVSGVQTTLPVLLLALLGDQSWSSARATRRAAGRRSGDRRSRNAAPRRQEHRRDVPEGPALAPSAQPDDGPRARSPGDCRAGRPATDRLIGSLWPAASREDGKGVLCA